MYNQNAVSSISVASGGSSLTYYNPPDVAATPKTRRLSDELQHLAQAIQEAHKLTTELDNVLAPVLSPMPPAPGTADGTTPQSANVVTIVAEQTRWLHVLNSRLSLLLQRIEL